MAQPPPRSPFPGFRVIIIGAGPAGLSAAHGLALAGIDFLLLERRAGSVVGQDDVGASLVLSPASVRVMQQFGIADRLVHGSGSGSGCGEDGQRGVAAASRGGTEMEENFVLDAKGRVVSRTETARIFKQCHGIGQLALHRAELVRALYEGLSAESRSKILLGQHITDIQQNHGGDDNDVSGGGGVRVTCADGTVHTGSIVIGADGVNSFARAAMRRLALADWRQKKKEKKKRAADKGEEEKKSKDGSAASTAPGSSDTHDDHDDDDDQGLDWDPEDPFPAEYVCLWATLPPPPSSSPDPNPAAVPAASTTSSSSSSPWAGMSCNTHDAGRSTMHVAGKDRSWVFLFEKLAGTTAAAAAAAGGPTRDNKMRYTEHDMRAMAERFGEYHITPPGWAGDGSGGGGAGKGMKIKDAFAAAAQAEDDQGQQHGTPLPAAPKMRWGMTILGEGVARNWHYSGLVVLVGDACHKFTPNAGQGFNTGLQDVVALCNLLRGALAAAAAAAAAAAGQEASGQEEEEGTKPRDEASHPVITGEPTRTETPAGQAPMPTPTRTPLLLLLPQHALEALFREYYVSRRDEAASMQQMSASYTRIQAVASLGWRLVGWLLGGEAVQGLLIRWLIAPQLARSLVLDYVPFEDRYVGSVPWAMTCTGG